MPADHALEIQDDHAATGNPDLLARYQSLTPRQQQVCRLMAAGFLSKQIADQLGASINTIKTHRTEVFRKMQTSSLIELHRQLAALRLADLLPGDNLEQAGLAATPQRGAQALRILVIEDNLMLRDALVAALTGFGHKVSSHGYGDNLVRDPFMDTIDIALLDIGLGAGHVDGLTLASQIRQERRCGVILLTAHGNLADRIRGFELGADAYLVKPVDFKELNAVINSLGRRLRAR